MRPSDSRLLIGLRYKAEELGQQLQGMTQAQYVDDIHLILDELIKRQDTAFYQSRYRQMHELAEAGLAILGERSAHTVREQLQSKLEPVPRDIDIAWNSRETGRQIAVVMGVIDGVVDALTKKGESDIKPFLAEVCRLETDLLSWTEEEAHNELKKGIPGGFEVSAEQLADYLRRKHPDWSDLEVSRFHKLPGGYSKTTVLFETLDNLNGKQALVMRAEQPLTPFHMDGADITNEFAVLSLAYESGVPVAEPLWLEDDPAQLGVRFLVSRQAPGETYGNVMKGNTVLSEEAIQALLSNLVKIHNTPLDMAHPMVQRSHLKKWLQYPTLTEFTNAYVRYWIDLGVRNDMEASPVFTRAANWLLNNVPVCEDPPVLIHGDYSLHNIMIQDHRISAILDWEASHVGDPADEFTYFSLAMSHSISPEKLVQLYRELGGRPIDEYRLRYFDVINCIKCPVTGYGSLSLIDKHPEVDVKVAYVGYQFLYRMLGLVDESIQRAEAARSG